MDSRIIFADMVIKELNNSFVYWHTVNTGGKFFTAKPMFDRNQVSILLQYFTEAENAVAHSDK